MLSGFPSPMMGGGGIGASPSVTLNKAGQLQMGIGP